MRKSTLFYASAVCLITAAVLAALLTEWYPLERVEARLYDARLRLRPTPSASSVVIVGIDEESVKHIGPLPWPRAYISFMTRRLHEYGAKVIGIDLLYSQRDFNPALTAIQDIIKRIRSELRTQQRDNVVEIFTALLEAEKKLDNDALFASSLAEARNVVLPLSLLFTEARDGDPASDRSAALERNALPQPLDGAPEGTAMIAPLKSFTQRALALGHVNRFPDRDGIVRSEALFVNYQGRAVPSFSLQVLLASAGLDVRQISVTRHELRAGALSIPIDASGRLLVSFDGERPFTYVSFSEVAKGAVPAETFADKIVLLGYRAASGGTLVRTPHGETMPGIELTARAVTAMLSGAQPLRPPWARFAEAAGILFFGLLWALLIPRLKPDFGALVILASVSVWSGAAVWLFAGSGYWLRIAPFLALGFFCLLPLVFMQRPSEAEPEEAPETDVIENGYLRLVVGGRTDTGRVREHNEDSLCVEKTLGLLAVADGIGGHTSGEVASTMALEALREDLKRDEEDAEESDNYSNNGYAPATRRLGAAVRYANRTVYETAQQTPRWRRMGTTLAAVLVRGDRLSIAHVGDSRVYLVRSGVIEQLTDDHSLIQPSMKHVLTKALGIGAEVEADLTELTLSDGDIVLLCTDGLSAMIADSALAAAVATDRDPFKVCTRLITAANKSGGRDNITVIVAYVYRRSTAPHIVTAKGAPDE